MMEEQQADAIAVIGMDARFPGAGDVNEYWKNLVGGVESITHFSPGEFDPSVTREQYEAPGYVPARGVLRDADKFDAEFFGFSPREAEMLDPQQRVFLELVWRGLEDAGYAPDTHSQLVGVFAGMSYNTYFAAHVAKHPEKLAMYGDIPAMIANEKDYLTTRAAYKLNLRGPAINISTACSTSLVAVTHAFNALLEYQCDIAVAGGVSVLCPQERGYQYTEGSIYSPDGKCRPFDASARGTIFGNGGGVVVLKRLSEALEDGDTVHAVIRGAALNNDGADKVSFTAPSVDGQAEVIQMAQEIAGISPDEIDYIEAHGTGTTLGDPIEIAALTKAFRRGTNRTGYCGIGSVKANIGHLDVASGVAGLIKAVLALRERTLPATLHYNEANPALHLEESPFRVVDELREWEAPAGRPRRAAVSSFGLGGTNAHVILEEAPAPEPAPAARTQQLLLLSAKTESALQRAGRTLGAYLDEHASDEKRYPLADIAWTLQVGRTNFEHRLALVAISRKEAAEVLLKGDASRVQQRQADAQPPGMVFMFPGQGSQYAGMGRQLYAEEPVVRETIDTCADALKGVLEHDLREVMFDDIDNAVELLDETRYTQPALFALELAIARLWMSWGIRPQAMLGHSIGEFVAATLAGVFSIDDAIRVVAERGRLMQEQSAGSMLSVRLSRSETEQRMPEGISIAAVNAPELCVVSGDTTAIQRFRAKLEADDVRCRELRTSHAFHSVMMEPALEPFEQFLSGIRLSAPTIPVISTLTGEPLEAEQAMDPAYWSRQLREPVNFHQALLAARDSASRIFLEIGPGIATSTFAGQTFIEDEAVSVAVSLGKSGESQDEMHAMLSALGRLWLHGLEPDWRAVHGGEKRRRVSVPGYSFERTRHWLESTGEEGVPAITEQKIAPESTSSLSSGEVSSKAGLEPEAADTDKPAVERIRDLIMEVTGMSADKLPADKSFTELGLDSLALTQFAQLLRKRLGIDLRFRQLLEDYGNIDAVTALLPGKTTQAETKSVAPPDSERQPAAHQPAAGSETRSSLTQSQQDYVEELCRRYTWRTSGSRSRVRTHRPHFADARSVANFDPRLKEMAYPLVLQSSSGSHVEDVDGNAYVDLVGGFGINLLGHSSPILLEAVRKQLKRGYEIGALTTLAGDVAGLFHRVTGHDRVAFCATGSEAVLTAIRAARTATGRERVVMFEGGYHGVFDEVLAVRDMNGKAVPAALGIPPAMLENIEVLPYGSAEAIKRIEELGDQVAAVLIEPAQARYPERFSPEFLDELRAATTRSGAALIFDEMVSGFRAHPAGVQGMLGIEADLATYGKICGGGLPIGVLAGKRAYMDALDGGDWSYGDNSTPGTRVTFHAGTHSRHPLSLAAAEAVLEHLLAEGPALQKELSRRTEALVEEMEVHCRETDAPVRIHRFASWFMIKVDERVPCGNILFHRMRAGGVHVLEGRPCFLSTAHNETDRQVISRVFRESIDELKGAGFFEGVELEDRQPESDQPMEQGATTTHSAATASARPPRPDARLGRRPDGQPAWFIPDPARPGRYRELKTAGQER